MNNKNLIISILYLCSLFFSCSNEKKTDVIYLLNNTLSIDFIESFRQLETDESIRIYGDTLSPFIIRNLKLDNEKTELFEKYNIDNNIQRAELILFTWHNDLNGIDFDLESQLIEIRNKRKQLRKNQEKIESTALRNYNSFNVGDSISFYYEYAISTITGGKRIVIDQELKGIDKMGSEIIVLSGVLLKKMEINKTDNLKFKVKLFSIDHEKAYLNMKYLNENDTVLLNLEKHSETIIKYVE